MDDLIVINYNTNVDDFITRIKELIETKTSFLVNVEMGKQQTAVLVIERIIESAGLKCRVRTANRGWAVGAITLFTLGVGAVAAAAVGAHDLATINPDYEIVKEMFGSGIRVEYMKSKE